MNGSPAVQRLGPAVLLQGAALAEVHYLVCLGAQYREHRDAIAPSPRLLGLLATLTAAISEGGPRHRAIDDAPDSSGSAQVVDQVGSDEAARLLGLSRRQVQRLGPSIGARKFGRGLVFDRAAVIAYAAEREQET